MTTNILILIVAYRSSRHPALESRQSAGQQSFRAEPRGPGGDVRSALLVVGVRLVPVVFKMDISVSED